MQHQDPNAPDYSPLPTPEPVTEPAPTPPNAPADVAAANVGSAGLFGDVPLDWTDKLSSKPLGGVMDTVDAHRMVLLQIEYLTLAIEEIKERKAERVAIEKAEREWQFERARKFLAEYPT